MMELPVTANTALTMAAISPVIDMGSILRMLVQVEQ